MNRWVGNVFVERLWRSVKYKGVYLEAYDNMSDASNALDIYFDKHRIILLGERQYWISYHTSAWLWQTRQYAANHVNQEYSVDTMVDAYIHLCQTNIKG